MTTYIQTLLGHISRGIFSLLLLSIPLMACTDKTNIDINRSDKSSSEEVSTKDILAWTEWELTSPSYAGLVDSPSLKFTDTGLNASVGLNTIFGSYKIDGEVLSIEPLASTRMAGPNELMTAEDDYSKALQSVQHFEISADGQHLTLHGKAPLSFRLTGMTTQGFIPAETKIINVNPQLGGDKAPKYLQLQDLSERVSWGHFSEAEILDFDFVPGYRYQLQVVVERDARSGEKRLRLLKTVSQQWMETAEIEADQKIIEVAPTKVACVGVSTRQCLQVREPNGQWTNFYAPIEGFEFQEGWKYRLQVTVSQIDNPPTDGSSLRYTLVRLLDRLPVIQ